jgi:hypothetical protein
MGVRWDGYTSDDSVLFANFLISTNANRVFTQYGHRRPVAWSNHRQWGPGVDVQAVVDAELQTVRGSIDWWQYDWYPPPSCFAGDPSNQPPQSGLMNPFEAHRVSAYKKLCKFGVMIDPGWWSMNTMPLSLPDNWGRTAAYRAHLVACMQDSQYMTIGGRPIIGVYSYQNLSAGNRTTWLSTELPALLAAAQAVGVALNGFYILIQDHNSVARADHLPFAGRLSRVTYGPNPVLNGPNGQYPWETQRANDVALWGSAGGGEFLSCTLTPTQDGRPLGLTDARPWIDQPSMPQLVQHISAAFNDFQTGVGTPDLVSYHAWSENTETGPGIIPTIQEHRRYLDAVSWARTGVRPPFYMYELDAAQLNFTQTGTWAKSAQTLGMFNGDEITSSATNDKVDFTHERCLHLGVLATKGPDRGIMNVYITDNSGNFVLAAQPDLYDPIVSYQNQVFMSTRLNGGTHSIRVEVSGTKNGSSSSNKIGYDACRIVYTP